MCNVKKITMPILITYILINSLNSCICSLSLTLASTKDCTCYIGRSLSGSCMKCHGVSLIHVLYLFVLFFVHTLWFGLRKNEYLPKIEVTSNKSKNLNLKSGIETLHMKSSYAKTTLVFINFS